MGRDAPCHRCEKWNCVCQVFPNLPAKAPECTSDCHECGLPPGGHNQDCGPKAAVVTEETKICDKCGQPYQWSCTYCYYGNGGRHNHEIPATPAPQFAVGDTGTDSSGAEFTVVHVHNKNVLFVEYATGGWGVQFPSTSCRPTVAAAAPFAVGDKCIYSSCGVEHEATVVAAGPKYMGVSYLGGRALAHDFELRPLPATEEIEVVLREVVDHFHRKFWAERVPDHGHATGRTATVRFTVPKRSK